VWYPLTNAADENVIGDREDNGSDDDEADALKGQTDDIVGGPERLEKPTAECCARDTESDVEDPAIAAVVDDLADDESRDEPESNPHHKCHRNSQFPQELSLGPAVAAVCAVSNIERPRSSEGTYVWQRTYANGKLA
jgi:hypothetical protein